MKVLQFTDLHFPSMIETNLWDTKNAYRCFKQVLEDARIQHWEASLAVLTGDLAEEPTSDAYGLLRDCVKPLGIPVYRLPGNHDDPVIMNAILSGGIIKAGLCRIAR